AALLSWKPAGVLIVPSSDAFATRDMLDFSRIPYVIIDRIAEAPAADAVTVDNEAAAAMAARHLIELGHRPLLVPATTLKLANTRERCQGIAAAWAEAGLGKPAVLEVGLTFEEASERVSAHIARHGRPTAVIALTNVTTLAVLSAFARLSIAIPQDASLIGF